MYADEDIIVYVSDNCLACDSVIRQLERWKIAYVTRNITRSQTYLKEMQREGYYSAPVTIMKKLNRSILGFNRNTLRFLLSVDRTMSEGSNFLYFNKHITL